MSIINAWNRFWFSPVPLVNLALFRIVLAGTLFSIYLPRQFDLDLFFTEKGILPKELVFQVIPEFFRPPVMLAFWPDSFVPSAHLILLLLLFLVFLGVGNRIFASALALLAVYFDQAFLQRNMSVMFGADQIGGIFLTYLALSDHSSRLSLKSILSPRSGGKKFSSDLLTPVLYRLIQVQLCIIYAYTGFEKLKGNSWWDGTALWSVFANPQFVVVDMTWTRHIPWAIVGTSFATILFEIYFPVLVWMKSLRNYVLAFGILFHSGIGIIMALYGFALVMMAPYILFTNHEILESFLRRMGKTLGIVSK